MKEWKLNVAALAFTGSAIALGLWSISNLRIAGSFLNPSDIAIVNDLFPVKIVQPEWFAPDHSGLMFEWMLAETLTRLGIVFLLWVTGMLTINRFIKRQRGKSNQEAHAIVA